MSFLFNKKVHNKKGVFISLFLILFFLTYFFFPNEVFGPVIPIQEPDIEVDPSSIDFGSLSVGQFLDQSIIVSNQGNEDLSIYSITLPNLPFLIVEENCSNQILSSIQLCTILVRFLPISSGNFSSSFLISSNDPDESEFKVELTGIGLEPQTLPPFSGKSPSGRKGDSINLQVKNLISQKNYKQACKIMKEWAHLFTPEQIKTICERTSLENTNLELEEMFKYLPQLKINLPPPKTKFFPKG